MTILKMKYESNSNRYASKIKKDICCFILELLNNMNEMDIWHYNQNN